MGGKKKGENNNPNVGSYYVNVAPNYNDDVDNEIQKTQSEKKIIQIYAHTKNQRDVPRKEQVAKRLLRKHCLLT